MLICSLFLLGMACSNEDSLTATVDPAPVSGGNANPYAVTVEEALANLDQALALIDGETRAGGMRRAVSVDRVKAADVCDLTRSEAALDVEDLLYVVSFGEGNGSAVLGADKRVIPVLAVLDETVLEPEDFLNGKTRSSNMGSTPKMVESEEELVDFVTDLMADPAAIIDPGLPINPPIFPDTLTGYRTIERTTNVVQVAPMLKTKWTQSAPFNNSCPLKSDYSGRRPAGCTVIAICQFLNYHHWPNPNIINYQSFDWDDISFFEYGYTNPTEAQLEELADYVYHIGVTIDADYMSSDNSTPAYLQELVGLLGEIGITSSYIPLNTTTAQSIVVEKGPVCMCGYTANNASGHSWVIDGWNSCTVQTIRQTFKGGSIIPVKEEVIAETHTKKMHCNMGWGGLCDGYYDYHVLGFDTTVPLDSENVDTSIGDYRGTGGYNFVTSFSMVSY